MKRLQKECQFGRRKRFLGFLMIIYLKFAESSLYRNSFDRITICPNFYFWNYHLPSFLLFHHSVQSLCNWNIIKNMHLFNKNLVSTIFEIWISRQNFFSSWCYHGANVELYNFLISAIFSCAEFGEYSCAWKNLFYLLVILVAWSIDSKEW